MDSLGYFISIWLRYTYLVLLLDTISFLDKAEGIARDDRKCSGDFFLMGYAGFYTWK